MEYSQNSWLIQQLAKNKWSLSSDSTRIVDTHPSNENKIKTAARDLLVTQLKFCNFDPDYSLFVCCAVQYCAVLYGIVFTSIEITSLFTPIVF